MSRIKHQIEVPCPRCGGRGVLPQFYHVEAGICFRCRGKLVEVKEVPLQVRVIARKQEPRSHTGKNIVDAQFTYRQDGEVVTAFHFRHKHDFADLNQAERLVRKIEQAGITPEHCRQSEHWEEC